MCCELVIELDLPLVTVVLCYLPTKVRMADDIATRVSDSSSIFSPWAHVQ